MVKMETLGILMDKKEKTVAPRSIAALWSFDKGCRHLLTEVQLQTPGKGERLVVDALWDTGASSCAVSKELAYKMGLKPKGRIETGLADGSIIEAETADLLFYLPDGTSTKAEVSILDMADKKYDFIVGMDVILQGNFEIIKTSEGFDFYFKINKH